MPEHENEATRSGNRALQGTNEDNLPRITDRPVSSTIRYVIRLGYRYSLGLLNGFHCTQCGRLQLDPLGWNGRRQPLCEACADPEVPGR